MFVLGVVGVCCRGVEEWAEAAVQRVEADECVKTMQGVAVDDGERRPIGREEYGEEVERGPLLVETLADPGPGSLRFGVAPCRTKLLERLPGRVRCSSSPTTCSCCPVSGLRGRLAGDFTGVHAECSPLEAASPLALAAEEGEGEVESLDFAPPALRDGPVAAVQEVFLQARHPSDRSDQSAADSLCHQCPHPPEQKRSRRRPSAIASTAISSRNALRRSSRGVSPAIFPS